MIERTTMHNSPFMSTLLNLFIVVFGHFNTFLGGGMGGVKIKIKIHIRPAKAEVGAELGNMMS